MKQGNCGSLVDLAKRAQHAHSNHRDYYMDLGDSAVIDGGKGYHTAKHGRSALSKTATRNLCYLTGMPQSAFRYLSDNGHGEQLDSVMNREIQKRKDRRVLVRENWEGSQNNTRALLSTRYRRLDNLELLSRAIPTLHKHQVEFCSGDLTQDHLYLKFVTRKKVAIRVGDEIQGGITLSNGETGNFQLAMSEFVLRLLCTNGMAGSTETAMYTRKHSGSDSEVFSADEAEAIWKDFERNLEIALNSVNLEEYVRKCQEALERGFKELNNDSWERIQKWLKLSDQETERVNINYSVEGDRNVFGLAQAVTRTAQDLDSYTRATELETIGRSVIEMSPRQYEYVMA